MGFITNPIKDLFGSLSGSSATKDAAKIQSKGAAAGIAENQRQFDFIQELISPQVEAGDTARQQQMALLGLLGPEAQTAAQANFAESPGQKFMRDRQERALIRNQSATGGLGGGNIKTALQQQAAGFAQQDFGNQFNRLAGLSGSGQAATNNIGQFGQASTGNISNLLNTQAQAGASGILGAQQANQGLFGQLLGGGLALFSDERLKSKVKKIGSIGRLDLFSWVWNDSKKQDKGFIAQQVKKVYPDLVKDINGFLAVDYNTAIERELWH